MFGLFQAEKARTRPIVAELKKQRTTEGGLFPTYKHFLVQNCCF